MSKFKAAGVLFVGSLVLMSACSDTSDDSANLKPEVEVSNSLDEVEAELTEIQQEMSGKEFECLRQLKTSDSNIYDMYGGSQFELKACDVPKVSISESSEGAVLTSSSSFEFPFDAEKDQTIRLVSWHYQDHHGARVTVKVVTPSGKTMLKYDQDNEYEYEYGTEYPVSDQGEGYQKIIGPDKIKLIEDGEYRIVSEIIHPGESIRLNTLFKIE